MAQAAIAIVLIVSNRGPQFIQVIGPSDAYFAPRYLPASVVRFVETNLPAAPAIVPAYELLGGRDRSVNTPWLIAAFGLAGIWIWFFVGQFLDDAIAALRKRLTPRRRIVDGLFFALMIASTCIVLIESDIADFALSLQESSARAYSLPWIVVGCTALFAQVAWDRKTKVHLACSKQSL
ncbi:MAG TPA: hypothetical protein VK828_12815 [Terriglobales bacterium]|nr:hypothetical protein [Terriglobales bacterium]